MDIQMITSIWACIAYITSYICKPEKTMSELMKKASKEAQDKSITDQLYHVADKMRRGREVSHHEAIMRLSSIPFRRSNVAVTFIATDQKSDRTRMLKPQHILNSMKDNENNIYLPSIHDKYAARPDTLTDLTLAEFAASFSMSKKPPVSSEEQPEIDAPECTTGAKHYTLKDNLGVIHKRNTPQVIRYHYISKQTDEEKYYHRLLLLYMPWKNEEDLIKAGSYKQTFETEKQHILPTLRNFEKYIEDVEHVIDTFDPDEVGPEAWDQVATSVEQDKDHQDNSIPTPSYAFLDPDILPPETTSNRPAVQHKPLYTVTTTYRMPDADYYSSIRSLNTQQRQLFDFTFNWASQHRLHKEPPPFFIFLSGGAGVGKTHLVKTIYESLLRTLRCPGQNPDQPPVIVTASTGKAASNIDGTTLHSAFKLPIRGKDNPKLEYRKAGKETLNTMQAMYQNLKLIIIDEISMIGTKSFLHLHLRLQDIFDDHTEPFAAVSILTVGDLLQLNPVGQSAVFQLPGDGYTRLGGSLWTQHFLLHELLQIVRQQNDPEFGELLSRVRTGQMTTEDLQAIKNLENIPTDDFPPDTVHLFLTNEQVRQCNADKIAPLPNKLTIKATDSRRETHTNTVPVTITSKKLGDTGGLPESLTIALGAKLMITKNINVQDHLVNGAVGTLEHIDINPAKPMNGTLYLHFTNDKTGAQTKSYSPPHLRHCVPIKPMTERFILDKKCPVQVERTMYPLVLAFAMTTHKSQGGTYETLIADFSIPPTMTTTQPGQIYTVLSRITERKGLKLINFSPQKIKVNEAALKEMQRMQQNNLFTWQHPLQVSQHTDSFSIGYLNISSYSLHAQDLMADSSLTSLSILALSETHITSPKDVTDIPNFTLIHKTTDHGLAILINNKIVAQQLSSQPTLPVPLTAYEGCLQIMMHIIHNSLPRPLLIMVTYRSHDINTTTFFQELSNIFNLIPTDLDVILGGDFNTHSDDPLVIKFTEDFHLHQSITEPTHRLGNTLDLIFTSRNITSTPAIVSPVPYSDHFISCTTLSMQ
jgi:DNA replication protein DnaC